MSRCRRVHTSQEGIVVIMRFQIAKHRPVKREYRQVEKRDSDAGHEDWVMDELFPILQLGR